jgi:hypothetical protein
MSEDPISGRLGIGRFRPGPMLATSHRIGSIVARDRCLLKGIGSCKETSLNHAIGPFHPALERGEIS